MVWRGKTEGGKTKEVGGMGEKDEGIKEYKLAVTKCHGCTVQHRECSQ